VVQKSSNCSGVECGKVVYVVACSHHEVESQVDCVHPPIYGVISILLLAKFRQKDKFKFKNSKMK
jgi:hypothetical protein